MWNFCLFEMFWSLSFALDKSRLLQKPVNPRLWILMLL